MKRFLIATATVAIIIFAVQITAYGATTTVINSEWISDGVKVSSSAEFDQELEFDEVLKSVHGFLLIDYHNTDEITIMDDDYGKWGHFEFVNYVPSGRYGNIEIDGPDVGSDHGIFEAFAYFLTDEAEGKTRIYLRGELIQYGKNLTGIAILGELSDGTVVNVWGRKTGLSVMNLHGDRRYGFLTVNLVLKIPEEGVVRERGDVIFRFNVSTKNETFDRILRLPEDAEAAGDGYYYVSDHFEYHSPPPVSNPVVNIVTIRQKPSALYETEENICSTDLKNATETTINIEWTERLRKSGKTIYAAGETH